MNSLIAFGPMVLILVLLILVVVLAGGFAILRLIQGRAARRSLVAWAAREGYLIATARRLAPYQYPAELTRDPRVATGVYAWKFLAIDAEGKQRNGYVRFPMTEGRFAPPMLAIWESSGPAFDDIK